MLDRLCIVCGCLYTPTDDNQKRCRPCSRKHRQRYGEVREAMRQDREIETFWHHYEGAD